MIGQSLSHYRITEKLGQGGMGEVYRAEDTNLSRQVAIKVLPDEFAHDAERLARFEREAKLLASLNHPNIASIYGLEEHEGKRFLVLELVEGQTLAERLKKGRIPLDETLDICRQIAEGLETAHEKGIIHRDLKPANVKVTPEGKVKILDFGLAKAFHDQPSSSDISHCPTLNEQMTQPGVILGTAAFMSPEQIRGKPVDRQADIWAFGCVLYEALTGRRAFPGKSITEILAGILEREPKWEELENVSPPIRDLLRRCLRKDPAKRLHDIADARIEIDEALAGTSEPRVEDRRTRWSIWERHHRLFWVGSMIVVLSAGVAIGLLLLRQNPVERVMQFTLELPSDKPVAFGLETPPAISISPDGSDIVYAGAPKGKPSQLFLRSLGRPDVQQIAGTEGAYDPFFSRDGKWIGFFADGKLKKVPLSGGAASTLCDAPRGWGGTWGPGNHISFAHSLSSGLWQIPADGGTPKAITFLQPRQGEQQHGSPQLLPDGRSILFEVWTGSNFDSARIALLNTRTGEVRTLLNGGSNPVYIKTGRIVYARNDTLLAVPFDLSKLELSGTPVPVLRNVMSARGLGIPVFAVSQNGVLVYAPATAQEDDLLVRVDRKGRTEPILKERRPIGRVRLSPDGRRIAFSTIRTEYDIRVFELARSLFTRVTMYPGWNGFPVWSPKGDRIAFSSARTGSFNLFSQASDGSDPTVELLSPAYPRWPTSWSPDGSTLAYHELKPETGFDIGAVEFGTKEVTSRPLVQTRFNERWASFSPDGKWFAYDSDISGLPAVYVQSYRNAAQPMQIGSGIEPFWVPGGGELLYRDGSKMMSVEIHDLRRAQFGKPRVLFDVPNLWVSDASPDGTWLIGIERPEIPTIDKLDVVLNWFEQIENIVSVNK